MANPKPTANQPRRRVKTAAQRAGQRFRSETTEHKMTVLHEDGLYRHVRFANPKSSFYWFELITWPGHLTVNGDMGTWTFSRVEDMFAFFRSGSGWNDGSINPGYWAEKIRGDRDSATAYCDRKLRTIVAEDANEYEDEYPGLRKAVWEQIFNGDYDLSYEETARLAIDQFSHTVDEQTFRFNDAWEWDVKEYSVFYLWCCHAIQWGIQQYDRAKVSVSAKAGA